MKTVKKLFLGFVLAMVFSVTMIPIIWVFFSSFKSKKELMTKPWSLPEKFLFSNYSNAWQKADFAVLTKNSVTITAFSLLLMLVFATMLAFAISRYKGNLSQVTLIYLLAGQTISAGMIIFPIVIVLRKLGFGSSHAGLILTYAAGGLPFAVFVLQGFFAGIPYELYEAGEIDGAGEFKIFANIAIPLSVYVGVERVCAGIYHCEQAGEEDNYRRALLCGKRIFKYGLCDGVCRSHDRMYSNHYYLSDFPEIFDSGTDRGSGERMSEA